MSIENNKKQIGNWFSKQSTIIKVLLGIVGICCIGLIILTVIGMLIPGGINWEFGTNNTDAFPLETTVQGVTFHLPEGYNLVQSDTSSSEYQTFVYSNGTSENITITTFLTLSEEELLSTLKLSPKFSNINENVSFGENYGFTADSATGVKVFVFEKGGKSFSLELSDGLNFDEYVPKIIK